MNEPTPQQALEILAKATEPSVKLSRSDYVVIDIALQVLQKLIEANTKPEVKEELKITNGESTT